MNRIADFTRAEELRVRSAQKDPLQDSETWMKEKIEGWRAANRNASDIGRSLLSLVVFLNGFAAVLYLGLSQIEGLRNSQVAEVGRALDFTLIGVIAGVAATVAGCLMHRALVESSTLDILETWRNLNTKETKRRKTAQNSSTILFWITANFVVVSMVLFVQGAWVARDALI